MATIQHFASRRLGSDATRPSSGPVTRKPPIWLWLPALVVGVIVVLPLLYLVARASEAVVRAAVAGKVTRDRNLVAV